MCANISRNNHFLSLLLLHVCSMCVNCWALLSTTYIPNFMYDDLGMIQYKIQISEPTVQMISKSSLAPEWKPGQVAQKPCVSMDSIRDRRRIRSHCCWGGIPLWGEISQVLCSLACVTERLYNAVIENGDYVRLQSKVGLWPVYLLEWKDGKMKELSWRQREIIRLLAYIRSRMDVWNGAWWLLHANKEIRKHDKRELY